jgi:hypothetical protein
VKVLGSSPYAKFPWLFLVGFFFLVVEGFLAFWLPALRPVLDGGRRGRDGKTLGEKKRKGGVSVLWYRV